MDIKGKQILWPGQIVRGLLVGLLTGFVIYIFALIIAKSTEMNSKFPFLVLLIPLGAVLTFYLYKLFGPTYRNSTVEAIDDINNSYRAGKNLASSQVPDDICPQMGVVAIIATAITHITGASGGKEGSGVQVGLACASIVEKGESLLYKLLKKEHDHHSDIYLMCGAGAAFAALFSSPIAGILFATQLASPKTTRLDAWLPVTVSSFTAVLLSKSMGIHILHIPAITPLPFNLPNALFIAFFALLVGLYSRVFCYLLHQLKHLFQNKIKRDYLQVLVPSMLLLAASLLTFILFGSFRYNGLGGNLLEELITGRANHVDDLCKMLMVALTFASGFAGGEVVPLLIVGAGFGMSIAKFTGVEVTALASLGALGMLSGGTNLSLVCFALGLELFGYTEPTLLFLTVSLSFIASGRSGIYSHQIKPY